MKKKNVFIVVIVIVLVLAVVVGGSLWMKKETERVSKNQSLNAAKGVLDGARLYYAEQVLKEQPVYDGVEVIDLELMGKYPDNAADLTVSFEDGVINIGVMKFEHGCYEIDSNKVKEADCSLVGTQNNDSNSDEPSKDENEGPVVENIDINAPIVISAMDKILCDFSESEICSFVEFAVYERYFRELLSYDNLDDDAISGMVYMYSDKHNLIDTTNIDKINQEILENECTNESGSCAYTTGIMSVENFQEVMKILFGNKVAYRHVNVDYHSSRPLAFYYHSGSNTYRGPSGFGGFCFPEIYTKLLSASKYANQLRVDVKAYHGNDCGSMYYTFDSEEPFYDGPDDDDANGIDPDIIFDRFSDQIQKYRFVFTEDNGQYYFDHVEKLS